MIITDVRLIDGIADQARKHVDVLIDTDGRIAAVDDHRPGQHVAHEGTTWSGAGSTLLPGLIDCHAHYTIDARLEVSDGIADAHRAGPADAAFIGARNTAQALRSGVTTARSGGAAHGRDRLNPSLARPRRTPPSSARAPSD